jgi:hypothetical protein
LLLCLESLPHSVGDTGDLLLAIISRRVLPVSSFAEMSPRIIKSARKKRRMLSGITGTQHAQYVS